MVMVTFAVTYPAGHRCHSPYYDEVDGTGATRAQAIQAAHAAAADLYAPGYTLLELPPGGSAGAVYY